MAGDAHAEAVPGRQPDIRVYCQMHAESKDEKPGGDLKPLFENRPPRRAAQRLPQKRILLFLRRFPYSIISAPVPATNFAPRPVVFLTSFVM
jgi:hypothetical protein